MKIWVALQENTVYSEWHMVALSRYRMKPEKGVYVGDGVIAYQNFLKLTGIKLKKRQQIQIEVRRVNGKVLDRIPQQNNHPKNQKRR